ncbi:MAG: GNAT family N-acetyltransferase [Rhodobacteraceae bacterium]|nr:GNAT family N-acetyltransferase [Paracoccaceae bacterium]
MTYIIHQITPQNLDLLSTVAVDVFDRQINADLLRNYASAANALMFVATIDAALVGQIRAHIILHPDQPSELYIENLGVTPAHQRRGLARALITALLDLARSRGISDVYVATEPDNKIAQAVYVAMGWQASSATFFSGKC